jgi:peroxiredoxin
VIRAHSILPVFCVGLLVALIPGRGISQERPARHAPNFALTTLDGKPLHLSDYSGKVVLLDFWATWCVPCQTEVPRFVSFQRQFEKQGFQVVGISVDDTPDPVRKFYSKYR